MLHQLWQLCATDKGIVEEQHPLLFTPPPPKGKVTQSVIRSMGLYSTVLTDQVQLYGTKITFFKWICPFLLVNRWAALPKVHILICSPEQNSYQKD